MTLGAGREDVAVEIPQVRASLHGEGRWGKKPRCDRQKMSFCLRVSGWLRLQDVPRKVMDVSYFAESKGLVG